MNFAIAAIAANLTSLACVIIAGVLANSGKEGWGWFLFIALLAAGSVKFGNNKT